MKAPFQPVRFPLCNDDGHYKLFSTSLPVTMSAKQLKTKKGIIVEEEQNNTTTLKIEDVSNKFQTSGHAIRGSPEIEFYLYANICK